PPRLVFDDAHAALACLLSYATLFRSPRFPDLSQPYIRELIALAEQVALENKLRVHKGVLIAVTGPNLETAAEYRAFRRMGADCRSGEHTSALQSREKLVCRLLLEQKP